MLQCWPGPAYASGCLRCHQKKLKCPGPTRAKAPAPAVHPTPCSMVAPVVSSAQLSHTGWGPLESLDADEDLVPDATHLEQLKHQACLSCLALGLKCEMDAPGEVCRQCLLAHHGTVLPARLCMRPVPLAHISVFQWHILGADGVPRDVWASLQSLDLSHISVSCDVDWDLTLIVADVVGFLDPNQSRLWSRSTSKVGMLCCPEFALLVRHQVSAEACFLFQAMLYGASFVYLQSDQQRHAYDLFTPALAQLAAAAGDRFLHYLDQQLQPAELAAADLARRQGLFLLVFGTILAVSYAQSNQAVATSSESELRDAMSTHLCERLAHHLVLLGQSIGAVFDKNEERVVLRRPLHRWDQKGTYNWVNKAVTRPLRRGVGQVKRRDTSRSCRRKATATSTQSVSCQSQSHICRAPGGRCTCNSISVKSTHSWPSPPGGPPRRLLLEAALRPCGMKQVSETEFRIRPKEDGTQVSINDLLKVVQALVMVMRKHERCWHYETSTESKLTFLGQHLTFLGQHCEGHLTEEQALRIIKTGTEFLRAEPNLLDMYAPIAICCEFHWQCVLSGSSGGREIRFYRMAKPLQLAGLV